MRRSATTAGHCGKLPFDYVSLETGEMRPASCKAVRCPICGPFEIRRRAWRAAMAKPERFLTLTALPADFQEARAAEARFLKLLRRRGYVVEWAIAHELTKAGQRHAHALVKGDYIPQRTVSAAAARAGMGSVADIRRIRSTGATTYALKEAFRAVSYATKGVEQLAEHLSLNGGRLYRTTRGYWT